MQEAEPLPAMPCAAAGWSAVIAQRALRRSRTKGAYDTNRHRGSDALQGGGCAARLYSFETHAIAPSLDGGLAKSSLRQENAGHTS